MIRSWIFVIALMLASILSLERAAKAAPLLDSPSDLIAAVNGLRASNGLPAYKVNNKLMAAAQAQSDYQASVGQVTHTGPGGSRPTDRAKAAGYGGDQRISISENIAGGTNLGTETVVQMWQGDTAHLNTMLGSYVHVGAGVSVSGETVYYTLVVGYISGSPGTSTLSRVDTTNAPESASTPSGSVAAPFVLSTAREDGSIVHVVGEGQTLWTIAAIYEVPLDQIRSLNGLTEFSLIYPGDKLIIRSPDQPAEEDNQLETPSPTSPPPTQTMTLTPTRTPRPTRTSRPTEPVALAEVAPTEEIVAPQTQTLPNLGSSWRGLAQIVLVILVLLAGGLVFIGNMQDRRREGR